MALNHKLGTKAYKDVKNWRGDVAHPTDDLVHWSDNDPEATMKKLQSAYDLIAAAGLLEELDILLDAAVDHEQCVRAEADAGEDI